MSSVIAVQADRKVKKSLYYTLCPRRTVPPATPLVGRIKLRYPLAIPANSTEWVGGLIPLPQDYAELMNLAGEFTCGNSVTGKLTR